MNIMKMGKNPNYLGSWDLDEAGHNLTLSIKKIVDEKVTGGDGRESTCTVCYFAEDFKPMILNVTNKKRIAKVYKTIMTENLEGKRIMITTEKVKAFGEVYDALRIIQQIPPSPTEKKFFCSVCGNQINPFGKMNAEQVAAYTEKKYGKCMCSECASKEAEKEE